jgi:hypothetical protein
VIRTLEELYLDFLFILEDLWLSPSPDLAQPFPKVDFYKG